eukprot:7388686-Prymnesium_polylepis.1
MTRVSLTLSVSAAHFRLCPLHVASRPRAPRNSHPHSFTPPSPETAQPKRHCLTRVSLTLSVSATHFRLCPLHVASRPRAPRNSHPHSFTPPSPETAQPKRHCLTPVPLEMAVHKDGEACA